MYEMDGFGKSIFSLFLLGLHLRFLFIGGPIKIHLTRRRVNSSYFMSVGLSLVGALTSIGVVMLNDEVAYLYG